MIGILLVTHAKLGDNLIETVEFISGEQPANVHAVSIDIREKPQILRKKIQDGINKVNSDKGVIIFTDMFGGTPSNLSLSFLKEDKIEVITGVNLPILLRAIIIREKNDFKKTILSVVEHGKKSIALASSILNNNGKK